MSVSCNSKVKGLITVTDARLVETCFMLVNLLVRFRVFDFYLIMFVRHLLS